MTTTSPLNKPPSLEQHLQTHFGYDLFREGQRDVVEHVMAGKHGLVVMPTGGGKSLCYQLPAMLLPGATLVVSPLIALMKDQVDSLEEYGLPATYVNSTVPPGEQFRRVRDVVAGRTKMLFVAPERFRSDAFWGAFEGVEVSLLAIDEAHCISQWGHDFRPDYLALREVRKRLGEPATLALTATATPKVRKDIRAQLGLTDAKTFLSGFERENLFLEVFKAGGKFDKLRRLEALLRTMGRPAIVYCTTRKQVEEVAQEMSHRFENVAYYHAGLPDEKRDAVQDDFMDGVVEVLVATNAFGMGVDKSDIRCIVHYQLPGSLEAYYQEAGRAGRDGEPAHCLVLYNYADTRVHEFFITHSYPEKGTVKRVWGALKRLDPQGQGVPFHTIQRDADVHDFSLDSCFKLLMRAGHAKMDGRDRVVTRLDDARTLRIDWDEHAERREYERNRLKRVVFYSTGKRCRSADILRYFGSRGDERRGCGHCDVCVGTPDYDRVLPFETAQGGAPSRRRPAPPKAGGKIACDDEPVTLARKIAACVARCQQRERSRTVAQVLVGSKAKSLRRRDLHKLSTYGILRGMKRVDAERLLGLLVAERFLTVRGGKIALSPTAIQVMKGEADLDASLHMKFNELVGR